MSTPSSVGSPITVGEATPATVQGLSSSPYTAPNELVGRLIYYKWGYVDRSRIGNFKVLPIELILAIFKLIPFRQRLRMVIQVCKAFQGLMTEKSLWRTVETCNIVSGLILLAMIKPGPSGGSFLPEGCIRELTLELDGGGNMHHTARVLRINMIQALHSQGHVLTSLVVKGYWMDTLIYQLSQQVKAPAEKIKVNLTQITYLELTSLGGSSSYHPSLSKDLVALVTFMPQLAHLQISRYNEQANNVHTKVVDTQVLLKISQACPRLRTLILSCWPFSLCALEYLGSFFPNLEVLECHIITDSRDADPRSNSVSCLPHLVSFAMSGYDENSITEDVLSTFFIRLLNQAQNLRELSWKNLFKCSRPTGTESRDQPPDLFKEAKRLYKGKGWAKIESPELREVVLDGWREMGALKEDLWNCPKVRVAPWIATTHKDPLRY